MYRIFVVDDDTVAANLILSSLKCDEYELSIFTSPLSLLEALLLEPCDLVISDYHMPDLNGLELLSKIQNHDAKIPFIIVTHDGDFELALTCIKNGASDYITKPFETDKLRFRVAKTLEAAKNRNMLRQLEYERTLLDMENRQLLSWRAMYAHKDVHQTEQLIELLTRNMNAAGGFMWLDILPSMTSEGPDSTVILPKDLLNLIVESSTNHQRTFNFLTFLSHINQVFLDDTPRRLGIFHSEVQLIIKDECERWCVPNNRLYSINVSEVPHGCELRQDMDIFRRIISELLINAIKYSPDASCIYFETWVEQKGPSSYYVISVRNIPKPVSVRDKDGTLIQGIPYEQSERVFDLFYTIEAFPTHLEGEEWCDGTGLFIVRKLLKRQNCWINAANGTDYTKGDAELFVKFTITIPIA